MHPYQSRILWFTTVSFQKDKPPSKLPPATSLTNQQSPLEGNRKQRRLQNYNSLPVFFLPLIHPSRHSPHPASVLLTFSLPFFLFSLPDSFSSYNFRTSSFPFSSSRLMLSVSQTRCFLWHTLFHPYFFILHCLILSLPSSFSCKERPVSPPPHQWHRTMGPIFSPGFSPLIRVPARFFPMAEQKTSSLLLGTNPLHPGLSNGLEGAMRLTVYPLQLERSPSLFLFSCPHLSVWGRVIWFTFKVQFHFFTMGYFTILPFVNDANSLHPASTSHFLLLLESSNSSTLLV